MPLESSCSRTIRSSLALAVLLVLPWTNGTAQEAAFSSRHLPPDPSWQATRGARAATSPAMAAGMGNPAAASRGDSHGLAFSHLSWTGGLSREWVAATYRLPNGWTASGDAALLRSDALEGLNEEGAETGAFQPSEWSAGLSISLPVAASWSAGFGVRTFRLEDESDPLTGLGASLGLHWNGQERRLGAAVTDLGPETTGGDSPYSLPTRWRAGYEQDLMLGRWTLAGGVEGDLEGRSRILLGFTFRPVAWFEILGGMAAGSEDGSDPLGTWSAGGRLRQGPMELSYAFLPGGELEAAHQIGLTFLLRARDAQMSLESGGEWEPNGIHSPARSPEPGKVRDGAGSGEPGLAGSPLQDPDPDLDQKTGAPAESGFLLWAGRFRSLESAQSEARWLRTRGCGDARTVLQGDGSMRVLAGQAATLAEAEQMADGWKSRGVLVTVERGTSTAP